MNNPANTGKTKMVNEMSNQNESTVIYTLRTQDEIVAHVNNIENDDYAMSALWYAIVHGTTNFLDAKNPTTAKRLLGAKFFELLPMDKVECEVTGKKIFKFCKIGAGELSKKILSDESLGASVNDKTVSRYLEIHHDGVPFRANADQFQKFCLSVNDYFVAKKETKAKQKDGLAQMKTSCASAAMAVAGSPIANEKAWEVRFKEYEIQAKFYAQLCELASLTEFSVAMKNELGEHLASEEHTLQISGTALVVSE